jgi:hypothetical protein
MPHHSHHPEPHSRIRRTPPGDSSVIMKEVERYRLEYTTQAVIPYLFDAHNDTEALRKVAKHLGIAYPLVRHVFARCHAKGVYRIDTGKQIYPFAH